MVTVDQPSEYYGSPVQNSDGQWRNDSRAEILVEDALAKAYEQQPDFPWDDFDVWDPMDYDGDGIYNERDGYIDHFVLVFAGKGQSSCQSIYSLNQKFTPNAPSNLYEELSSDEQECAQRIWPHRFSLTKNNGKGPEVEGLINRRGGVELKEGLWVYGFMTTICSLNIQKCLHLYMNLVILLAYQMFMPAKPATLALLGK
jgi:immune inhibitor A